MQHFIIFVPIRRHSDDPLISGASADAAGALDDNQNEFDTLPDCSNSLASIEASPTNYNKKAPRMRKSGNIKLRFHHQALPQEYLDHYEATQNQFHTKEMTIGQSSSNARLNKKDRTATASTLPSPSNEHVSGEQESLDVKPEKPQCPQKTKHQNGKEASSKMDSDGTQLKLTAKQTTKMPPHDLPYMGEITLDNFKPRRGRKPKKADICHLIYKNYGTVFPNQKLDETEVGGEVKANSTVSNQSLLEKRLTTSGDSPDEPPLNSDGKSGGEEPLNLCVRDRYDSDVMTVISDDDATDSEKADFKPEMSLLSPNDTISSGNFPRNFKMALPNFQTALLDSKSELPDAAMDMDTDMNNYGCWQNSGMFLNPMVLYLQKIANANSNSSVTPSSNQSQSLSERPKVEAIESTNDANLSRTKPKRMLVPKKMSQLLKADVINSNTNHSTSTSTPTTAASNKATTSTQANQKNAQAPKRKRSAIFIPPLPEESSTNHATEVSICKFKFTGGAKPSLQEKKMLSVDAGGNFRYYSGTGDKSIRGYEFFPRESLKQSSLMAASSAGAFLNTAGQKIANDVPPPSFGLSNELLQIPEINATSSVGMLSAQNATKPHFHSSRKRKSKRSMQREKLEKTFKEKGFLIQTQQLEQAEGTYCKFRQLRKFTRYLFRSWKDYLPGELQQNQNQLNTAAAAAAAAGLSQASTSSNNDHNSIETPSSHFMSSPSSSHEE